MNELARIFASDPLTHTEADLTAIINEFREKRQLFKAGGKPAATPSTPKKIDLSSLGDL